MRLVLPEMFRRTRNDSIRFKQDEISYVTVILTFPILGNNRKGLSFILRISGLTALIFYPPGLRLEEAIKNYRTGSLLVKYVSDRIPDSISAAFSPGPSATCI